MNTQTNLQADLFDTRIYYDIESKQIKSDPAWDNGEAFPEFLEEISIFKWCLIPLRKTYKTTFNKKLCEYSICVPVSVLASPSHLYNWGDLKLLASQKSINTAAIASPHYSHKSTTTAILTNSPLRGDGGLNQEQSMLLPQVRRANHSAFKVNEKQPQTSETVSPHSSELLTNINHGISALKTYRDYSIAPTNQEAIASISDLSLKSFPSAGITANGKLYQADTLQAPLIAEEYCWLPAPTAMSTRSSRPPGLSKLENFLKKNKLIKKGEVLDPAILSQWFGIPQTWLDPSEFQTAIQILEDNERQQEIFSILELQRSHSEESNISNLAPDKSCPQCGAWLNPHKDSCQVCGWKIKKFLEENKLKVGDRVKVLNKNFGELGLVTQVKELQTNGWVVVDSDGTYHSDYLELIPENFLEETGKSKKRSPNRKPRNKKGSLYKYLENKKLKNGKIASYPRITSDFRDPENPHHWRWGYHWDEKINGKWKGRSIGSIPPGVIAYIQDMRDRNVQLPEIISFIKKVKAKK